MMSHSGSWAAILILLILMSCGTSPSPPSASWQLFSGRGLEGVPPKHPSIYRALIPLHWKRQDPLTPDFVTDTTKPICEFYIQEDEQIIRLTIHTFPIIQSNKRIPPQAQIIRWKQQFEELDPLTTQVIPESHGGFSGLYFEGQGQWQGHPSKVMGWSMQLAASYERQLALERQPLDLLKRADYTIKASGPIDLMDKYHSEIVAFAHSFELIDELPVPL